MELSQAARLRVPYWPTISSAHWIGQTQAVLSITLRINLRQFQRYCNSPAVFCACFTVMAARAFSAVAGSEVMRTLAASWIALRIAAAVGAKVFRITEVRS